MNEEYRLHIEFEESDEDELMDEDVQKLTFGEYLELRRELLSSYEELFEYLEDPDGWCS